MTITKDIREEQSLSSEEGPDVVDLTSGHIDQRLIKGFSITDEDPADSRESNHGNIQVTLHDDPFEYFVQSNHVRSI